jgi:hypothetical protein
VRTASHNRDGVSRRGGRLSAPAGRRIGVAAAALLMLAFGACDSAKPSVPAVVIANPVATATPSATLSPSPTTSTAPSASPIASVEPTSPALPPDIARLDGVRTDPARAGRLPLAIMIDDNVAARPQAGFNAASVVYQAPADGGEDRYMLVFQEGDAATVGPVRSGRPYFVRWAAEFRSAFGHYGGDLKTLQQVIPPIDGKLIYDVDALRNGGSAYHRISSRKAPHNAYTSTAAFRKQALRVGAPSVMVAGLAGWTFADDRPLAERPARGSITVPYGRGATGYAYDPKTNAYLRSVAGRPQVDAGDRRRVTARNVIVLYMRLSYDPQSEPGHRRPILDQIGTGKAIVFRDGQAIPATWRKDDPGGLTRFLDPTGNEITLVRGRVFIQVVATGTKVTYSVR